MFLSNSFRRCLFQVHYSHKPNTTKIPNTIYNITIYYIYYIFHIYYKIVIFFETFWYLDEVLRQLFYIDFLLIFHLIDEHSKPITNSVY